MDVPDTPRTMLVGFTVHVMPVEGLTLAVRATVPANASSDVTTKVDAPDAPELTAMLVGLATREKSWTVNEIDVP